MNVGKPVYNFLILIHGVTKRNFFEKNSSHMIESITMYLVTVTFKHSLRSNVPKTDGTGYSLDVNYLDGLI